MILPSFLEEVLEELTQEELGYIKADRPRIVRVIRDRFPSLGLSGADQIVKALAEMNQ